MRWMKMWLRAVLLPLFLFAVPVHAETLTAPDRATEPIEIGRHRTVLPNGASYDYDVSFPAQLRTLRSDGTVQTEEVTCYFKTTSPPATEGNKPAPKGDPFKQPGKKPPPTKEEWATGVCAGGLLITAGIACIDVKAICAAGGALVIPVFCGSVGLGCIVAEGVVATLVTAGTCTQPKAPPQPAQEPPANPESKLFWDIPPGSDRAPQFTPNLPAGDGADVFPEGESVWDFLQRELAWGFYQASLDPPSLGNDSVGAGVPPDNAAVTNGASGMLGGGVDPTPDPNDDPGDPTPDVGGGV